MPSGSSAKRRLLVAPTRCRLNEGLRASLLSVRRVILSLRRDWMVSEQLAHVAGGFAVVQRSHQFKRLLHAFQVGRELRFELVVEHGGFQKSELWSCRFKRLQAIHSSLIAKIRAKSRTAWRKHHGAVRLWGARRLRRAQPMHEAA